MLFNNRYIFVLIAVLLIVYFSFFFFSFRGWGYAGYGGYYHRRPSFWYWGGADYYPNPSARGGSLGGPGRMGGGIHGGK